MDNYNYIPLEQNIILDITDSQLDVIYANQYEENSRTIRCYIQDNGVDFDCSGYSITLYVKKSNGYKITKGINDVFGTVDGNIITFKVTKEMTYSYGNQDCSFEFVGNGGVVRSCSFILRVRKANVQMEDIEDSDNYESIHDDYLALEKIVESKSHEIYTTSSTAPNGQKVGDFWTELL